MNAQNAPSVILIILVTTSLHAQVVPGRWEKVETLDQEEEIIVTLKDGELIQGNYRSSSPNNISIRADQRTFDVPKLEVSKIVLVEDPLLDGTVKGLLWGLAGGAAIGGGIGSNEDLHAGLTIAFIAGIGAGIGTFIGRAVDKSRKEIEIVYQAP